MIYNATLASLPDSIWQDPRVANTPKANAAIEDLFSKKRLWRLAPRRVRQAAFGRFPHSHEQRLRQASGRLSVAAPLSASLPIGSLNTSGATRRPDLNRKRWITSGGSSISAVMRVGLGFSCPRRISRLLQAGAAARYEQPSRRCDSPGGRPTVEYSIARSHNGRETVHTTQPESHIRHPQKRELHQVDAQPSSLIPGPRARAVV